MYRDVDLCAKVRRAVMVEGSSERGAAKQFGIDRKTVSKMIRHSVPPGYQRKDPPVRVVQIVGSSTQMNDDTELIYSPLQQTYTESGRTIDIQIYRSADSGWPLEVVDENGGSTIWDAEFDTDQDALDQVMCEIKEDGIEALIRPEPEVTLH